MFCLEISSNSNTFSSYLFNKIPIKPFLTTDPTFHHLSSVEYYPISLDIWEDISLESSKSCYFSYLIYGLWDLVRSLTLLILLPNWQGIEYRDHYTHFLWALFLPNQCISRKTLHFKIDQLKHNIWASLMAVLKGSTCHTGDMSSIPGLERSPGEGHGNPLQYCCLGNPMDRWAW